MLSLGKNVRLINGGDWFCPNNPNSGEKKDESKDDGFVEEKRIKNVAWPDEEAIKIETTKDQDNSWRFLPGEIPSVSRRSWSAESGKSDSGPKLELKRRSEDDEAVKPRFLTGEGIDQIKVWIRSEFEGISSPELSKCPPSLVAALKNAVIKEAIRNSTGLRGVGDLRTVSGANSPKKEGGGKESDLATESDSEGQDELDEHLVLSSLKIIGDCDGRRYRVSDMRGAAAKIRESLVFIRMCNPTRLEFAMDDEGISFDPVQYKDLLIEKSTSFLESSANHGRESEGNIVSSGHPFASTVMLSRITELPVFQSPFWERFLNGKWKRNDYTFLSLDMFSRDQLRDDDLNSLLQALLNFGTVCYVVHGDHFREITGTRIDELRNPEWAIKPAGYVRYLLETSLCDYYVTLGRKYDRRTIGRGDQVLPSSLKDPARGAPTLLKYYLSRPKGSVDHLIHWQTVLEASVVKQRRPEWAAKTDKSCSSNIFSDDEEDRTKRSTRKRKRAATILAPPTDTSDEPPPRRSEPSGIAYCLRHLVATLCGGPLECPYDEECRFTHSKKGDLDLHLLRSQIDDATKHDFVRGFSVSLGASLLEAAST